jgi:beta-lactamase regulating signal transducer with metallopeptidase domain
MSAPAIEILGSALLHFLWQGAALALLLSVAISFSRQARVRYGLAVCTLALMAICPLATVAVLERATVSTSAATPVSDSLPASVTLSNVSVALHTAEPVTALDWLSCFVWIWSSGVVILGLRTFGGWVVLQRLRRTAQETVSPLLLESCRRLEKRIGVARLVRYAHSEIVEAPAVVGWFRPVILVPLSAMSGLSVEQIEAIVAHELAHIQRYDALVNLFQIAAETVLFYHPAVWWVNRLIRVERENCCDDIAVAVCGNASEYALALTMLSGKAPRAMWAMAANGGALKSRVSRLLGLRQISPGIPRAGLAVLAVLCASCVVLAAGAFKQEPPAPQPPPAPAPPAAPVDLLPPDVGSPDANLQEIDRHVKELERELKRKESAIDYTQMQRQLEAEMKQARAAAKQAAELERQARSDAAASPTERQRAELQRMAREAAALYALQAAPEQQKSEERNGPSYIDSLESVGLTKLTVDDLISLKVQGVTADYVRQVKAAGFDPSIHDLIGMKVQGITPEYIRDIRATGLKPNMHELIGMKVQGVTPEYIRALQSAGLGDLTIRDFISAKVQGVTPEFIEKVRSHGFKNLTFRQLIGLKMAGVF